MKAGRDYIILYTFHIPTDNSSHCLQGVRHFLTRTAERENIELEALTDGVRGKEKLQKRQGETPCITAQTLK